MNAIAFERKMENSELFPTMFILNCTKTNRNLLYIKKYKTLNSKSKGRLSKGCFTDRLS
jgi:hypothetical protein